MVVKWNNNRVSFQEHNERMRWFRRSHAGVALVNAPRPKEPSLLESTRPLPLSQIIIELGGTRLPHTNLDWANLMPVPKVASYKLSLN